MESFKIATKVWPTTPGAFAPDNLKQKFKESLTALKATKVDVFYLHMVDDTTPFEETVKAVDELYREGLFNRVIFQDEDFHNERNLYTRVTRQQTPHLTKIAFFSLCTV
jgi:aflatoxin B1 aldehyde reductase